MAGPAIRASKVVASHSHVRRTQRGFTMVELIVVMVLAGILAAVGVGRFFNRAGFDVDAFTEQTRAMLRFAQKMAVAQNRPVYVRLDGNSVALCYTSAAPCPAASQVRAPSGANSGTAATVQYCQSALWYCLGRPSGLTYALSPGAFAGAAAYLYFDALGRPYDASGSASFPGLTVTVAGDGLTRAIAVWPETGYVY